MPDHPSTPTMFGGFDPPHLPGRPELADLERAVVLGGEGGTLTLLGSASGSGDFCPLHFTQETVDEQGFPATVNVSLTSFGPDLLVALDRLQPAWRHMVGVHVAPRWEETLRADLERFGRPYEQWRHPFDDVPMRCTAVWPACDAWPDGRVQDGYWLEGNLDQARTLVGRLSFAHQVQLQTSPFAPFGVLVSRDAAHRIALEPGYPHSQMWSINPFVEIESFEVADPTRVERTLATHRLLVPRPDEDHQPGTLDRLCALPFEQFVGIAAQVMKTFGATVDEEAPSDPVIHLSGFLKLGQEGVLPLLLSAHVDQGHGPLTADMVERLRAQLHPGMPGLIITTGTFTLEAEQAAYEAPAPPIGLVDGALLTELVEQFNLLPPLEEQ